MNLVLTVIYISASLRLSNGHEGRLFYLAFMNTTYLKEWQNYPSLQEFFITSSATGIVTIKYGEPLNHEDTIILNSTNKWRYAKRIEPMNIAPPLNTKSNSAIIISSTMDISVQVNKACYKGGGDGYLALPITTNSKSFHLASYSANSVNSNWHNLLSIVGLFNNTVVRAMHSNTEILRITISAGEVYQQGFASPTDSTGFYVTSTQPIVVYSGHACANIPLGKCCCDHIIEQIPPVSQRGKTFIMASFHGRPHAVGFIVRVIAQSDITITYSVQKYDIMNHSLALEVFRTRSIGAGHWDETAINDTRNSVVVLVNCSDDCLVMQYNLGFEALGKDGRGETTYPDPFMVTVPALNHYTNDMRFSTSHDFNNVSAVDFSNGITVIAKTGELSKIYLDDGLVTNITGGAQYVLKVGAWSSYTIIIAPLSAGFHSVTANDPTVKYAVFVYGHGTRFQSSYGYLAGYGYNYDNNDQPITAADTFPPKTTKETTHTARTELPITVIVVVAGVLTVVAIVTFAVVAVNRRRNGGSSGSNHGREAQDLSNFRQNFSSGSYTSLDHYESVIKY